MKINKEPGKLVDIASLVSLLQKDIIKSDISETIIGQVIYITILDFTSVYHSVRP